MFVVGLTGGIGSGKTTAAKCFEALGIPVYTSDLRSRKLVDQDIEIKQNIIKAFGDDLYITNVLDRKKMAKVVFGNREKLDLLNSIIHPAIKKDFSAWLKLQEAPYVIKEAAILFESESHKDCHKTIVVVASESDRVKRVMARDGLDLKAIKERMASQWDDKKKVELADFVLQNDYLQTLEHKVFEIHSQLLKFAERQSMKANTL